MTELSCVVSGSFRRDLGGVRQTAELLEGAGIEVLAPRFTEARNPSDEFVFLDTDDPNMSPLELEQDYLRKISTADFHVTVNNNPASRLGLSAAAEFAHAALNGTVRYTTHNPKIHDYPLLVFSDEVYPKEQSALDRLSLNVINLMYIKDGVVFEMLRREVKRGDLNFHLEQDRPVLQGVVERLLEGLDT